MLEDEFASEAPTESYAYFELAEDPPLLIDSVVGDFPKASVPLLLSVAAKISAAGYNVAFMCQPVALKHGVTLQAKSRLWSGEMEEFDESMQNVKDDGKTIVLYTATHKEGGILLRYAVT